MEGGDLPAKGGVVEEEEGYGDGAPLKVVLVDDRGLRWGSYLMGSSSQESNRQCDHDVSKALEAESEHHERSTTVALDHPESET